MTIEGNIAMTTKEGTEVAIGQHWRQEDGYLCKVVGFGQNGWPFVRHVNAQQGGWLVNPGWFGHWTRTR
jgi:hypothetical protein